ncbi:hypothetical protein EDB92DRAFT_1806715 [Lactarius akahatsu]|uniref:RING-type E3 ubiquitin transferase n=1 Tax=Lactarius akahatsu TaxID=416441 RepID=A0AAD4Q2R0_9AGAM|nr:hypothetical protein EDB92DRAFT_1806715 [Lactarius akahatsu]
MADSFRPRLQSFAGSVLSHRVFLYSFASTLAVSATVLNALQNQSNFYSVAVYLSKSGASVLVLANFGLLLALMCGRLVQQIFFGSLRPVEVERLYDRMWFFVTESLLAFTIFRDEFDIPLAVMFGFLLFVKSFHWLLADRIEWMNQMPYPGPTTLFHIRISGLFFMLWVTNIVMLAFATESILTNGVGVIILFASEYSILMASLINSKAKYILSAIEFHRAASRGGENAPPWEDKSMWIFYVDLITAEDFLKLSTYLGFFAVIVTFYGVPLNVVRDVYVTARSFITRLRDLIRYRTATRNMDERYPNATQEEMSAMSDHTCIICREEMVLSDPSPRDQAVPPGTAAPTRDGPNMTPKKLPCGHIFHFHCLRSWLERQQSCPTCRRPVLDTTPSPVAGRVGQVDARGAAVVPPGAAPPFGPAADVPRPPAGHLGNLLRNMLRPPPQPAPPPAPYPPVPPQHFPVGGPPPPPYQWGPGFAHPPIGPHYVPPPQLQPPPVFQGYYGPGGVWQPWGDRRWPDAAAQQQQQQPAQQQHQEVPHNSVPATTAPAPAAQEDQSPSQLLPSAGERPSTQDQTTPSTPQEAAALAALRRSSGTPSSQHRKDSAAISQPQPTTSGPPTASGPSVPPTTATEAISPTPAPSATTIPTSGTPPSAPASTSPNMTVNVPSLIPMSVGMASVQRPSSAFLPTPPVVYRTLPQRYVPRPLATLPPTLTDAQLAQLDVLTRDAIDERLRVLEGVAHAMYRCAEELTRLRSVLPVSTRLAPTPTQVRSEPGQPTTQVPANESGNVPDIPPLDSDSELDARASNAKPGTDVSGASGGPAGGSIEANGEIAGTPGSAD